MRKGIVLAVMMLFLVGCVSKDDLVRLKGLKDQIKSLYSDLDALKEKFKSGEITINDFLAAEALVNSEIKSISKEAMDIKMQGDYTWWQMLGGIFTIFLGSTGILRLLPNKWSDNLTWAGKE